MAGKSSILKEFPDIPHTDMWFALPHYPEGVREMLDFIVRDLGDGSLSFQSGQAWFEAAQEDLRKELTWRMGLHPGALRPAKRLISTYDKFVEDIAELGFMVARTYSAANLVRECRASNKASHSLSAAHFLQPFLLVLYPAWSAAHQFKGYQSNIFSRAHRWMKSQLNPHTPIAKTYPRACVMVRDDILYVLAVSGHAFAGPDYAAFAEKRTKDLSPSELGALVRQAMGASRYYDPDADARAANLLFNVDGPKARSAWLRKEKRAHGVRTSTEFWASVIEANIVGEGRRFSIQLANTQPGASATKAHFTVEDADLRVGEMVQQVLRTGSAGF